MTAVVDTTEVLQHLDPKILAAHPENIRRSAGDLAGLKASIEELGILEPIVCRWAGDDGHVVVAGHRRLAAALELDQPTVPVRVIDFGSRSDLASMAAENLQRLDLTAGEEAATYVQLQAAGLDVAAIEAATGMARARIERGLTVAGSKAAAKAAAKLKELTLDQAAVLVEFESDDQALKDLTSTVKNNPAQFDHVAEGFRRAAASKVAYAAAVEKAKAAGAKVIEAGPGWAVSGKNCPLTYLGGAAFGAQTPAKHKKCPGHAVCIQRGHPKPQETLVCTDPKKYHPVLGDAPKAKATDAERAAAKAQAEELEQRREQWDTATAVRRAHVKKLLQRKAAPKGLLRVVVDAIVADPWLPGEGDESLYGDLAVELGIDPDKPLATRLPKATDAEAQLLLLALVAAGLESNLEGKNTPWETPPSWQHDLRARFRKYFTWLATTGYVLAPVEELITKPAKAKGTTDG